MRYRQLTQKQRYQIFARLETGASQRQIASELGIHSSTVSREIRRNAVCHGYDPEQAQTPSDWRRRLAWKTTKRLPSLIRWITRQLRDEWSPEQISGFMANVNGTRVSHEWIYSLIRDDKARGGHLWRALRLPQQRRYHRHLAKRAGLGKIPNRVGIEHRPTEVENRLHIGHWEGDTILKGHKASGLVTLVERRSGYLLAARLPHITAWRTASAMIRLLKPRRGAVKSITLDNGSEFAEHRQVAQAISASVYFCAPYRSSQRGTNENTNGLIRQYFPKGTDFQRVSDADLRRVVEKLNNRPRKRFGYRTPAQVFLGEHSGALETAGAALIG
ncbi:MULTISPECIES: IS30 family transposase [Halomonadaceae]|jgi:IS30 family transposase|uniref:IS30 family transposase n=1 Tax=Halomonadaceae TaxID=28256 RepID=UPI001583A644|nr:MULTISPECIES: IS30 family transposase [Halomonas]MDI4637432.1 IS30 family transposase [Halomonas sp. BMC7]NUJ61266.1 IS30 family transposase [Halomonas taeanensis]|tara:strand:+ start:30885 stop:31877 length:993 start_codon:yes stop_codon:yes gene_type:complete